MNRKALATEHLARRSYRDSLEQQEGYTLDSHGSIRRTTPKCSKAERRALRREAEAVNLKIAAMRDNSSAFRT